MYQPSQLNAYLDQLGVRAKKSLSQNFLVDGNVVRKIVSTAEVEAHSAVLEIGPGPGALTEELLSTGAQVIAVEKDRILASALQERLADQGHIQVLCDDILDVDLNTVLPEDKKVHVVANLPYSITTPILAQLLHSAERFHSITVMVQKEVAERMSAQPKSSAYGSLTVFLAFYSKVEYAFTVSRKCFHPIPKVDSAIAHIKIRPQPDVMSVQEFFKLTRGAFGKRRKMLRASLKELYPKEQLIDAAKKANIELTARPEALSLDDFVRLHNALSE